MNGDRLQGQTRSMVLDRNGQLRYGAMTIMAQCQHCTPEYLQLRLRAEHGATPHEAHRAVVRLIRNGDVKRTMFGELYLPGANRRGGGGYSIVTKFITVVGMLGIIAFMAWGMYQGVA
jgi:hypothetical protein